MELSSTANTTFTRTVTPSKSSSDRDANEENYAAVDEKNVRESDSQQKAINEKQQQQKEDSLRRLDGRLINLGYEENSKPNQEKKTSFNQSRVNEAYSPPSNETSQNNSQHNDSNESEINAIDLVV